MTPMETARLAIRQFVGEDWEALHEMIVQFEASEYAPYDHAWPTSPEEIRQVTARIAGDDRFLAVCKKDTGRLIGLVSLTPDKGDGPRGYNLGYCFNFHYHGRGYASEACRALIGQAFGELGAERVVAGTAAANGPSCRLLGRLGFGKTGESKVSFRNGLDGKPIEFLGYSFALSREDWERAHRPQNPRRYEGQGEASGS